MKNLPIWISWKSWIKKKKRKKQKRKKLPKRECFFCKQLFGTAKNSNKKYCSIECAEKNHDLIEYAVKTKNKNFAHSKIGGSFRGVFCASLYKLIFLIYMIEAEKINIRKNNISFIYYDNKGIKRNYCPYYVDTSNKFYDILSAKKTIYFYDKIDSVKNSGYQIQIIHYNSNEYLKMKNWVKEKYNTKNIYLLYDKLNTDYIHQYNCTFCKKSFISKLERRNVSGNFCSKRCLSMYNARYTNAIAKMRRNF